MIVEMKVVFREVVVLGDYMYVEVDGV